MSDHNTNVMCFRYVMSDHNTNVMCFRYAMSDQGTNVMCFRYAKSDGTNRHIVMQTKAPHPFAITVFEDYMYWTDWNHKTIEKANKFTGANHTRLQTLAHRPMDIHLYHPLRQKESMLAIKITM